MRILHYFLGFPPYRTGGLTKYATDLMKAQAADGHTVSALWPGRMRIVSKGPSIKQRKAIDAINNYELIDPLPVPLDEGITEFAEFTKSCDAEVYRSFLQKLEPDVIHIHTLMGLHREFITAASTLGIRTVFTTHDYFGICPKVTLYRYGQVCDHDDGCKACIQCNCNALSLNKIKLMQSPIYRHLKDSAVVKLLRKKHRGQFYASEALPEMPDVDVQTVSEEYSALRRYYREMLAQIDLIHFNSSVTESVYKRYLTPKASKVLTITHKDIADNRLVNEWKAGEKLRITCLAPAKPYKGFNILKAALDALWDEGKRDFELKMFGPVGSPSEYMTVREEGFTHDELGSIFAETDILAAVSVWYETFGFTVLEAISYGVPVLVSDRVGARDIAEGCGVVVHAESVEAVKNALLELTPEKQQVLRDNIRKNAEIKTWRTFVDENYKLYEDEV